MGCLVKYRIDRVEILKFCWIRIWYEGEIFCVKYEFLFDVSYFNGKYFYWLIFLRMFVVYVESKVLGLMKCFDGVLNYLLRVREGKGKVIENSYFV